MALAKRLAELVKSSGDKKKLHLSLLEAFNEHGQEASVFESIGFLVHLRKSRDSLSERSRSAASRQQEQQRWENEWMQHAGFPVLRQRLLSVDGLKGLSNADLSRMYNQLRRMGWRQEADEVWPTIATRLKKRKSDADSLHGNAKALLGIWSAAPEERLRQLDPAMAAAVGENLKDWQLLSTISRAPEVPSANAVERGSVELRRRLADLSSDDLALIIAQLGSRIPEQQRGVVSKASADLVGKAKAQLVERGGLLETHQLIGLIGCMEGSSDPLWRRLVQQQLLAKKDLTPPQTIDICRFLLKSQSKDSQLFNHIMQQLAALLRTKPEPGTVALASRNLDILVMHERACQALLNAAVRLRKDLYPTVLWSLFIHAGEVGLLQKYQSLRVRLESIGKLLEDHPVKRQKMPLSEMPAALEAMKQNGIIVEKSAREMGQQFIVAHARITKSEARHGQVVATDDPVVPDKQDSQIAGERADVQQYMLDFWLKLNALGIQEPEIADALESFCKADGPCEINTLSLLPLISILSGESGETAMRLQDGLVQHLASRLPQLPQKNIVDVALVATTPAMRQAVFAEVDRRIPMSTSMLRRVEDHDDLVALLRACAAWPLGTEADACSEDSASADVRRRILRLVVTSLPSVISQSESGDIQHRITETIKVFASLGRLSDRGLPEQLRMCLHQCGKQPMDLVDAAELSYAVATCCDGRLPLDVLARIWRLCGSAVDDVGAISVDFPAGPAAKLWSVGLAAHVLSSPATVAALRLTPNADSLDSLFTELSKRQVCFESAHGAGPTDTVAAARGAVSRGMPGVSCEERFAVPGTPYVADLALPSRHALLIVPQCAEDQQLGTVGGAGLLSSRILEAKGWRVHWLWPQDWNTAKASSEEDWAVSTLSKLLGDLDGRSEATL